MELGIALLFAYGHVVGFCYYNNFLKLAIGMIISLFGFFLLPPFINQPDDPFYCRCLFDIPPVTVAIIVLHHKYNDQLLTLGLASAQLILFMIPYKFGRWDFASHFKNCCVLSFLILVAWVY